MNIIYRTMTIDDYPPVYALWKATPGMGLNDIDDSVEGIAKYIDRNPNTSFVAELDGQIVGVIMAGHDGRRGYIHHTAVAQDFQGKGIGNRLVDAVMLAMGNEEITKVALMVFTENAKGNDFWEKRGFASREDIVYRNKLVAK